MEALIIYLGKVALAMGAFYLVYLFLFQKQKQFVFNRIYLPASMVISYLIPLITITLTKKVATLPSAFNFNVDETISPVLTSTNVSYDWFYYLFILLVVGVMGFISRFFIGYFKALSIIRKSNQQNKIGPGVCISSDDIHPFSFFNKVVISEKTLQHPHLNLILEHEFIHKKENHTFDILIAELLFFMQWFNPFAWLLKDAIKNNLEFITDNYVTLNNDRETYQLAMVSLADKKGIAPFLNALNGSQLKNRIIMMKQKTENKYAIAKQLVIIPVLTLLIIGLSNKEFKAEVPSVYKTTETLNKTSDDTKTTSEKMTVSGQITDNRGEPLSGVAVIIKGKSEGTITDQNGFYELKLDKGTSDIIYSMQGFEKQNITVNGNFTNNVVLKEDKTAQPVNIQKQAEYTQTISGQITNKKGDPLSSVSVIIKGKPVGTISDPDGNYIIGLKEKNETLVYALSGYEKTEIPVKKKKKINVTLRKSENSSSSEIKVTGYDNQNSNLNSSVKIRSTNGNLEPLILLDGKPVDNMDGINPDDIASVNVIKDESKIKPYGEKGKNGVVIVTSKNKEKINIRKTNENNSNAPVIIKTADGGTVKPLYIVDGEVVKTLENIQSEEMEAVLVLKDESATKMYGEKGKNGVVLITTKKAAYEKADKVLVVVDGKLYNSMEEANIHSDDIASMEVLKNESATKLYGEKGKNGVIIINSKTKSENKNPLFVVDGKITDSDIENFARETIQSVDVIKGEAAIEKYGIKGKNGVVEVTTKEFKKQ